MITGAIIGLTFLGLVIVPCAIGLRIRASLHPANRVQPGAEVIKA